MQHQGGAVNVAPVSCSGPTATTATPMPALTSAAEREQSDIEKLVCWAIAESLITQGPPGNRSYVSSLPANPEEMLRKEGVSKADITEADLVEKMRYLFASMDVGNRRYIDPSEALNVVSALAARSKSDVILGRQQDASEMMSNLMEWMEKGLALQETGPEAEQNDEIIKQSSPLVTSRSLEAMEISPVASVDAAGSAFMDSTVPDQREPDGTKNEEMITPVAANSEQLSAFAPELENAIKDLEEKHKQLCDRETELIKSIDNIYEKDDLKKHGYRLHAVAIHQGQASAGHYWAYVRKGNDDSQWEKFNDQRVESAAWSDIEAEAVGGIRTTSAYFLLYVSSSAEPWLFSDDCPTSSFLTNDIREQVENENAALESEIERYRCTQNEDAKGNTEVYENPRDDVEKEFSALPPPIGNEDELLSGTPLER
ncbi:ubiquitinyl hydrolase 1, partial [Teladorsagia circumcincta]